MWGWILVAALWLPHPAAAGGGTSSESPVWIDGTWASEHADIVVVAVGDPPLRTLLVVEGFETVFAGTSVRWTVGSQVQSDLPIGLDITGDGRPNMVAYDWSGGAHCCSDFYVFELGADARLLDVLYGGDYGVRFEDIDDRPGLEATVYEPVFTEWYSGTYDAPHPPVVLRWDGDAYVPAPDLMYRPRPATFDLMRMATALSRDPAWEVQRSKRRLDVPGALWSIWVRLAYQSNLAAAEQLLDLSWPAAKEGREVFCTELVCQLRRGWWWEVVAPMNGLAPEPPAEDCPEDARWN